MALSVASAASAATNLIVNGDFEAGNTGFMSDYVYDVPTYDQGEFSISTNPINVHPSWSSFGDHTTGTGNMLIVNGDDNPNAKVWYQQNIAVTPFTTYNFSGWFTSTYPESPAQLAFSINGTDLGPVFTLSATPGQWQQFSGTWNSGANNTASIAALVNRNVAYSGNDFAGDDFSLTAVPEPSAWALMIIGFGAAGSVLRQRRRMLPA
jgi:hypothetical protein